MLYEAPADADPIAEPLTLHELLIMEDELPSTLDDRFELAKGIASAICHLHSAGWMHKDVSSHNIVFFKSTTPSDEGGFYNLKTPYLRGFRFSRRVQIVRSDSDNVSTARSYNAFDAQKVY